MKRIGFKELFEVNTNCSESYYYKYLVAWLLFDALNDLVTLFDVNRFVILQDEDYNHTSKSKYFQTIM